eukprot:PITA_26900
MNNHKGMVSMRPPIFNGSNLVYWKIRARAYLQLLGADVWEIVEGGYQFLATIPKDSIGKNLYETNTKDVNTLLGSLSESEFFKVMQLKTAKETWDKIIHSYEGDSLVKLAKLQTLVIQYETLKMHSDESVASYFLRIDEIVNYMKNLGEEIKEVTLVEKILRSLSSKFESKVSAIEEKQDLQAIIVTQIHGILTAFEMRKGGPSDMREDAFKASAKGKEKEEHHESGHILEEEDEVNFVKKLQRGSRIFRDKYEKGKEYAKGNRKQVVNSSYFTHEDNDGLSNSDEDETKQDYRLLMAYENDNFLDALEEEDFLEEITKLKICLEEKNTIIDTLIDKLAERERHNENLECEIVGLRKDLEKTKPLNLRFSKGSETLNEIIKVQRSPLIKTGLGYTEESSQSYKRSNSTRSYLDAAKTSEQYVNRQKRPKTTHPVNHTQFNPRMNISRSRNQQVSNVKRFYDCRNFFNGQ